MARYKASIFDLLQVFVDAMTFNAVVYKVISSTPAPAPFKGNNILLNVNDVFHACKGMVITISGNLYKVIDWNENYLPADGIMQLTVNDITGANPITVIPGTPLAFSFPAPFFEHGTLRDTNEELAEKNTEWNKYPLIWCKEPVEEDFFDDRDEAHERKSSLEIYFLMANDDTKNNYDMYDQYVRPMTRLKDNFIEVINTESGNFPLGSVDRNDMTYRTREITKVAVMIAKKDRTQSIFADTLSGVALKFDMKLFWPDSNIFLG